MDRSEKSPTNPNLYLISEEMQLRLDMFQDLVRGCVEASDYIHLFANGMTSPKQRDIIRDRVVLHLDDCIRRATAIVRAYKS